MSPEPVVSKPAPRSRRPSVLAASVGLAWLASASASQAVVGGREDAGSLARSSVMVLSSRGGVCSAVVVAADAVLTAGHCGAGADQHRVYYRGPDGTPVLLVPAAVAVHPGYVADVVRTRRPSTDLALIRLAEPLPFGAAALSGSVPASGEAVTLGGYGVGREGDARSTGTFRSASLVAVEPYGPSRILLWAYDPARAGAGACQGDSGGPVAIGDGSVAAITSWAAGSGPKRCGAVSQAVLVAPQRGWIDAILAGWRTRATWR